MLLYTFICHLILTNNSEVFSIILFLCPFYTEKTEAQRGQVVCKKGTQAWVPQLHTWMHFSLTIPFDSSKMNFGKTTNSWYECILSTWNYIENFYILVFRTCTIVKSVYILSTFPYQLWWNTQGIIMCTSNLQVQMEYFKIYFTYLFFSLYFFFYFNLFLKWWVRKYFY